MEHGSDNGGALRHWGVEAFHERGPGGTTFILAMLDNSCAAGVRLDAAGGLDAMWATFEGASFAVGSDAASSRAALLGLLDPAHPEGVWGGWQARTGSRDAALWALGLGGRPGPSGFAALVEASGLGDVRAALGASTSDRGGAPYPWPTFAAFVDVPDPVVALRRRQAISAFPYAATIIVRDPFLTEVVDKGMPLRAALCRPSTWGLGRRRVPGDAAWRPASVARVARAPYPALAARIGEVVQGASCLPPEWVPADERGFRHVEALLAGLGEVRSWRAEHFQGRTSLPHDLPSLLAGSRGRWVTFVGRLASAASPGIAFPVADDARSWRALARGIRDAVEAGCAVGESFARQVLVPEVARAHGVTGARMPTVNGWRSLGAAALFGGSGLVAVARAPSRWRGGDHRVRAAIAGFTWPAPFDAGPVFGDVVAVPLCSTRALQGAAWRRFGPEAALDGLSGRMVHVSLRTPDGRGSLLGLRLLPAVDECGDPRFLVDEAFHDDVSGDPPEEDHVSAAMAVSAALSGCGPGIPREWVRWMTSRRTWGGPYAWVMRASHVQVDDPSLRRDTYEAWRPMMPRGLRRVALDDYVQAPAALPDVRATLNHLRAAGAIPFAHMRRAFALAADPGLPPIPRGSDQ